MTDQSPFIPPNAELETDAGEARYEPKVFSFHGRLGRLRFIVYLIGSNILLTLAFVPLVLITLGGSLFEGEQPELTVTAGIIFAAYIIAINAIMVMFGKRRLNDLNHSGWYVLIILAPIVFAFVESVLWIGEFASLILWIYLLYFPGSATTNKFGPVPSENPTITNILGLLIHVFFALLFGLAIYAIYFGIQQA